MNPHCVITTIHEPNEAIEKWHEIFGDNLIIVGDKKTSADWECNGIRPIFGKKIYAPDNSYCKKNLGYLQAMRNGADCIFSTDDDNEPNEEWKIRKDAVHSFPSYKKGWNNVYSFLISYHIWPRGFPLNKIYESGSLGRRGVYISSIQQGVANGDPDVDAVCRLTNRGEYYFRSDTSVTLMKNSWCPINSQSTWYFKDAFPLMYLPITANFRLCDIWGGLIAQRCLWELEEGVTFHSPAEVYQDRNQHDLMKDFEDEIPGYLNNDRIVKILEKLELKSGVQNICENLLTCYEALVNEDIFDLREVDSVKEWIKDYKEIYK